MRKGVRCMNEMRVTVMRGSGQNRYEAEYCVPCTAGLSVMDVLDYIYENLDPTLAYFSHEACRQTACGRCLVRVNGTVRLACGCPAEGERLVLAPWNDEVLRDLLCRFPAVE